VRVGKIGSVEEVWGDDRHDGLFTSFPAQAFAGHGYAVLLMNLPEGHGVYKDADFTTAKAAEIDNVVFAIRSAVDSLVARGIVDGNRLGIMGWSFGSFCTDYIVTHFPDWFRAANSGEEVSTIPEVTGSRTTPYGQACAGFSEAARMGSLLTTGKKFRPYSAQIAWRFLC
jgi:hypothetical protein